MTSGAIPAAGRRSDGYESNVRLRFVPRSHGHRAVHLRRSAGVPTGATGQKAGRRPAPAGHAVRVHLVFGQALEPHTPTRAFHAFCARPGLRRVRLHDLRHSRVSLLVALGVSPRVVMEIVGRSAIEMTMNVHAHVSRTNQRAPLALLDDQLTDGLR